MRGEERRREERRGVVGRDYRGLPGVR